MNKIKLVLFYLLYRNYFFSKNVIFFYILKIFFTMLHLKILKILYIFRISLCVTSPLEISQNSQEYTCARVSFL